MGDVDVVCDWNHSMLGSVVVVNTKLPETWIMLINNATENSLISSTDSSLTSAFIKVREKE